MMSGVFGDIAWEKDGAGWFGGEIGARMEREQGPRKVRIQDELYVTERTERFLDRIFYRNAWLLLISTSLTIKSDKKSADFRTHQGGEFIWVPEKGSEVL